MMSAASDEINDGNKSKCPLPGRCRHWLCTAGRGDTPPDIRWLDEWEDRWEKGRMEDEQQLPRCCE